jgi:NAD(P)-dependent dehydrogenase (short-subunit alcohol dehydrogenase family)
MSGVAIVTGAGRGIGGATVAALAAANEAAGEERVRAELADATDAVAMAAVVERAATIAFLRGPAGAVITGTTVSVDGGLSI